MNFYSFYNEGKNEYDFTINIENIAFDKENSIDLSADVLNILKSIISKYNEIAYGGELFYNKKGPNTGSSTENDIYISCLPTGNSEENVDILYDKPTTSVDILSSPIFKYIGGSILFIISFYMIHLLILFFSRNRPAM